MELRSLAYRTDLIFPRFDGVIRDRGSYLVVETPANPGFYWGNYLLFANPPTDRDYPEWIEIFRREFAHSPRVQHVALAWDGTEGEEGFVEPFVNDGFTLERSVVMTTTRVEAPAKYNKQVAVRPLASDAEWEAATENQIACRPPALEPLSYAEFKRSQMARYRAMSEAALGNWFGAFLGERLVGNLGIYRDGAIGRFQQVETHPDFRRQGICGALVHQASEFAFQKMGIETLVMVADPDDHPSRIYASVGFRPTERSVGMYWWKRAGS